MACIGPWQMMHGTVEFGVWNVALKEEPLLLEYILTTPLRVDLLEISDLFPAVPDGLWQFAL
jgi:hypothetical protein